MIGLALVCAGDEVRVWARALAAVDSVKVVYVVDPNLEAANTLAAELGGRATSTLGAALDDAAADAVLFTGTATPPESIVAAAKAGKAIAVPRPASTDRRRFDAIADAIEASAVPFYTAFLRRFDEPSTRLKEELVGGAIGRLEALSITSREPRLERPAAGELPAGLYDDLDLCRWLLADEPLEVYAATDLPIENRRSLHAIETVVHVSLKTASGKLAQIAHHSRSILDLEHRIEAIGEIGGLSAVNPEDDALTTWGEYGAHRERHLARVSARDRAARVAALQHFAAAVADPERPLLTGLHDARRAALLVDACLESIRSRKVIGVRAVGGSSSER